MSCNFDAVAPSASARSATRPRTAPARRRAATKTSADVPNGSPEDGAAGRGQRRRRSDDPGRQRNPARTRQLILDAANVEFGRYGYDGARVIRIAERAGVAHQLITYHFGGKKGLFEALSDRWVSTTKGLTDADAPFVEILPEIIRQAADDTSWDHALVREGYGPDHAHLVERLAPFLANAYKRQERGEIAPDLDPGIVALMFFAANMAPVALPHITRALSKVDPDDPKFLDYYAEQLSRVVKHIGASPTASR